MVDHPFIAKAAEAIRDKADKEQAQQDWAYERVVEAHLSQQLQGKTLVFCWWGSLLAIP